MSRRNAKVNWEKEYIYVASKGIIPYTINTFDVLSWFSVRHMFLLLPSFLTLCSFVGGRIDMHLAR